MGSRLTIRVGRVSPQGTVEFGKARVVEVSAQLRASEALPVPENPSAYPPCRCALCRRARRR